MLPRCPQRSVRLLSLLVIAVAAGCGGSGSTGPGQQVATTIAVSPSSGTLDALGATLQLSAAVRDQGGHAISGASVSWSSSDTAVLRVSGAGLVTAVHNGSATVTATSDTAHGHVSLTVAQAPHTVTKVSGDQQRGASGTTLPAPLVVQVDDRLAHPIAGVTIGFAAATGDGSVTPASATSGTNGRAQGTWKLGSTAGTQNVTVTPSGATGVSATFTATDTTGLPMPSITAVAPDTLVEGQAATISGTNFSTTMTSDSVLIDGRKAAVTAASATSLTITVPTSNCKPARSVNVSVTVSGQTASRSGVPVHPASFTSLAVGQEMMTQDTSAFCIQLRGSATTGETYIMGLSAPAESPSAILPFAITTTAGASGVGPMMASQPAVRASYATPGSGAVAMSPEQRHAMELAAGQAAGEAKLRAWDRAHLGTLRTAGPTAVSASVVSTAAASLPSIGDTLTLHVPNFNASNMCTSYATIKAVVRVIGSAGIWVTDASNPTLDSLTLAEIQSASDEFDAKIYATDTTYFGHPSDIDGNGRIIVALTKQVNLEMAGLAGFVFSGDLVPSLCSGGNAAEIYYGEVPWDTTGSAARTHADVVSNMPFIIAHEFTHIIQYAHRLVLNGLHTPLTSWEAEGQATLAEELVGDDVLGNSSYQNYGHTVALSGAGYNWYADEIFKWVEYYGDLGSGNQAANAPDLCTVYGNLSLSSTPCNLSAYYGASWIFQRYVADQYGPSYPGGLAQLTRDWISKNPDSTGTGDVAALLGVNYDSLFVRFSTALAVDDYDNGTGTAWIPAKFRITSWNSADLASYLQSAYMLGWLNPPAMGFATATANRSVRGGSTAYTVLSAAGAHPATSIRLTGQSGTALATGLRPALWIIRVK